MIDPADYDWNALDARFDWIRAMRGIRQDPIHHAEGDVWIHTRMVVEAMLALPSFQALAEPDKRIAFTAALLHDVAKPFSTQVSTDSDRVTAKGHSTKGASAARKILWRMNAPFADREAVVALVRHHQVPFWLLEREDPLELAARVSQTARCDLLAILAEADARGRHCADQAKILDGCTLFAEFCREKGCLDRPFAFPSAHARFLYFTGRQRDPSYTPHESFGSTVVLMSGLPGAGKDRWVHENLPDWPVVSLDRLRAELDVDPEDDQGTIVQEARNAAREHLRAGRSFVWNATNVSKKLRAQCIRLFADYGAYVRIKYVDVPETTLLSQNRARSAVVPEDVIDRLLDRWEVPDLTEAHEVF